MIRINLLPIKQDRRKEAGRNQLFIGFLIIFAGMVAATLIYLNTTAKLDEQKNANNAIESEVRRIETRLKDHNKIIKEIEEYEARQESIDNLQAARTGPAFMMLEMSKILSKGGRPNFNNEKYQQMIQANPALAMDENWDYRRLWLDSFIEKDRKIKISGQAITHEDVAEFLRRINLSSFFTQSMLVSTRLTNPRITGQVSIPKSSDSVVRFEITGEIRYR